MKSHEMSVTSFYVTIRTFFSIFLLIIVYVLKLIDTYALIGIRELSLAYNCSRGEVGLVAWLTLGKGYNLLCQTQSPSYSYFFLFAK